MRASPDGAPRSTLWLHGAPGAMDRRRRRGQACARLRGELRRGGIDELGDLARDDDAGLREVLDGEVSIVEVGEVDQPRGLKAGNVGVDPEVVDPGRREEPRAEIDQVAGWRLRKQRAAADELAEQRERGKRGPLHRDL